MLKAEALAALGDTEAACCLLRAAIENVQSTGERYLLWRLCARLGGLYRVMGRQLEAEVELSKACENIQELADSLPDGELRDNFVRRAIERLSVSP